MASGGSALGKRKEMEPDEPAADNRLLAGYLAHEFLTQGTLFGERFDPKGMEAEPEPGRNPTRSRMRQPYAHVACLLKESGGAHVPGVINPTQLGRWLRITE